MTKAETIDAAMRGDGCLGKSQDDEPVFVLCARDRLAPTVIREWVKLRAQQRGIADAKCRDAFELAGEMERWLNRMSFDETAP